MGTTVPPVQPDNSIPPAPEERGLQWSWSDRLAIALACLAGVMALILFWIDKTPLAAGISIAAMAALLVYPVLHFLSSKRMRVSAFVVLAVLLAIFGWMIWPKRSIATSPPLGQPQSLQQPPNAGGGTGSLPTSAAAIPPTSGVTHQPPPQPTVHPHRVPPVPAGTTPPHEVLPLPPGIDPRIWVEVESCPPDSQRLYMNNSLALGGPDGACGLEIVGKRPICLVMDDRSFAIARAGPGICTKEHNNPPICSAFYQLPGCPPVEPQATTPAPQQHCETGSICNQDSPVKAPQTVNNFKEPPPPTVVPLAQTYLPPIPPFVPPSNLAENMQAVIEYNNSLGVERGAKAFTSAPGLELTFHVSSMFPDPDFRVGCDQPCRITSISTGGRDRSGNSRRSSGVPSPLTPGTEVTITVRSLNGEPLKNATVIPIITPP
jgi:hypothetical protein